MFPNWSDCVVVSNGATLSIIGKSLCSEDLKVPFVNYWILQHPSPFLQSAPLSRTPLRPVTAHNVSRVVFARALKGLKKQIHLGRTYYLRHFRSRFFANKQERFLFACRLHCPSNEFHFEIRTGILTDSYLCLNK